MDIQDRIVANIRDQAVIGAHIESLMQDVEKHRSQLSHKMGAIELLQDMFMEETGVDINEHMNSDEDFKRRIIEAREEGQRIAAGDPKPSVAIKPSENKTPVTTGVTTHKSNRPSLVKKDHPEAPIVRKRQPPVVEIDDNPPTQEQGDPED